jgi:AcrR family transcriptional regulator
MDRLARRGAHEPQIRHKSGTRGVPRAVREQWILDVAGQVFARGGYFASSMDEIARLADVSKPMLYAYFGSKEGLYVAYIDRTGRELLARLQAAAPGERRAMVALRARIEEFLAFIEEHRDGWTVLFRELTSSRPLADEVASLRAQIAEAVRGMITSSSAQPCMGEDESDAIAHAIVGVGESLANWWLEHPHVPRSQVVDWYVDMVKAALAR